MQVSLWLMVKVKHIRILPNERGTTANQKLACFVLCRKIINTVFEK